MSNLVTIEQILQSWLDQRGIADQAVFEHCLNSVSLQHVDKSEYLVRAGQHSRRLFLIHRGLLRLYYTSADGKERNKAFYSQGDITGAVSAALTDSAAPFSIQALEPGVILQAEFDQLFGEHQHPALTRLAITLLSEAFIRNEQREAMLLTCTAEQRYQWLCEREPHLLKRLPQLHIASYIGVDAVSLSRLKRKLKPGS
ncbi:MAG: Crp/Fnr family transcriptional regulator [Pseudomonadota bacterium]